MTIIELQQARTKLPDNFSRHGGNTFNKAEGFSLYLVNFDVVWCYDEQRKRARCWHLSVIDHFDPVNPKLADHLERKNEPPAGGARQKTQAS